MGSLLVLPLQLRRVPVAAGFRTHLDAAATLGFPMDARLRASALPDDAACAVATAVSYGGRLDAARRAAVGTLKPIADRWRPVSARVNRELMHATVYRISARRVNSIFMAVLVDALEWLDVTLISGFIFGFAVVGAIADSGVYRAVDPPASDAEYLDRLAAFNATTAAWNRRLHQRLAARRWGTPAEDTTDRAVTAKTRQGALQGPRGGPIRLAHGSPPGPRDAVATAPAQRARAPDTQPVWRETKG